MFVRAARRILIAVIGGTLVLLGAIMLVAPGPGIPVVLGGLAVLATEFLFAARLMQRVKAQARALAQRAGLG
jgi:hypothetical protein